MRGPSSSGLASIRIHHDDPALMGSLPQKTPKTDKRRARLATLDPNTVTPGSRRRKKVSRNTKPAPISFSLDPVDDAPSTEDVLARISKATPAKTKVSTRQPRAVAEVVPEAAPVQKRPPAVKPKPKPPVEAVEAQPSLAPAPKLPPPIAPRTRSKVAKPPSEHALASEAPSSRGPCRVPSLKKARVPTPTRKAPNEPVIAPTNESGAAAAPSKKKRPPSIRPRRSGSLATSAAAAAERTAAAAERTAAAAAAAAAERTAAAAAASTPTPTTTGTMEVDPTAQPTADRDPRAAQPSIPEQPPAPVSTATASPPASPPKLRRQPQRASAKMRAAWPPPPPKTRGDVTERVCKKSRWAAGSTIRSDGEVVLTPEHRRVLRLKATLAELKQREVQLRIDMEEAREDMAAKLFGKCPVSPDTPVVSPVTSASPSQLRAVRFGPRTRGSLRAADRAAASSALTRSSHGGLRRSLRHAKASPRATDSPVLDPAARRRKRLHDRLTAKLASFSAELSHVLDQQDQCEEDLELAINAPIGGGWDPTLSLPDEVLTTILLFLPWENIWKGTCVRVCKRWRELLLANRSVLRVKREGRWEAYTKGWLRPEVLSGHTAPVRALAVSSDGKVYSGGADGRVQVWTGTNPRPLRSLDGHTDAVYALAVAETGDVYSASSDLTVRVWDGETGAGLRTLEGHTDSVFALATQGSRAYSGGADATIICWSTQHGNRVGTLIGHTGHVSALTIGPKERLYSASSDGTVRVWARDGRSLQILDGHHLGVFCLLVRPYEVLVSGGRDTHVRLWVGEDHTPLASLDAHGSTVTALANGREAADVLFTASTDGNILMWSQFGRTGAEDVCSVYSADIPFALALSPDGTLYAGTASGDVLAF